MKNFGDRLFVDLRGENPSVWKTSDTETEKLFELPITGIKTLEGLRSEVLDPFAERIASMALPVSLVIPDRFLLFRVFTIPVSHAQKETDLLAYEVEQSFPHADGELIWCHTPLVNDAIEAHHLVAAIRTSAFGSFVSGLAALGVPSVELIPSLYFDLVEDSKYLDDAKTDGVRHLIKLEKDYFISVSYAINGGLVRSKTLHDNSTHKTHSPGELPGLINKELKKTCTAVKRSLKASTCVGVSLCGSLVPDRAWLESMRSELNVHTDTRFESFSAEFGALLVSYLESEKRGTTLSEAVPEQATAGNHSSLLWVAAILVAAAPFAWVWGNAKVINAYDREIASANRSIAETRSLSSEMDALSDEMSILLQECELHVRQLKQRQSLVALFQYFQDSLSAVGDTWIENMDLVLSEGGTEGVLLKFSGKFLVRESNMKQEVRQRALEGAEASLSKLQETLLASKWVESVVEFKVNYAGMDSGINVVPFSMELKLGEPFSTNSSGEEVFQ